MRKISSKKVVTSVPKTLRNCSVLDITESCGARVMRKIGSIAVCASMLGSLTRWIVRGTAIATTNMFVMLGAMLLQPLIGRLLDWSVISRHAGQAMDALTGDQLRQLYTAGDYQFAMAVIPIGIFGAAILTFFLKETHAHAGCNPKEP